MHNPTPSAQQGESVLVDDVRGQYCTYYYVAGQLQTKSCTIRDPEIAYCFTAFSDHSFGRRQGWLPNIYGGDVVYVTRLVDTAARATQITGLYAEQLGSVGYAGNGTATARISLESLSLSVFQQSQYTTGLHLQRSFFIQKLLLCYILRVRP